jgi:hypothetical protein
MTFSTSSIAELAIQLCQLKKLNVILALEKFQKETNMPSALPAISIIILNVLDLPVTISLSQSTTNVSNAVPNRFPSLE